MTAMSELDHIQSRRREHGMSPKDWALQMAICQDLASRSEDEADADRAYWHTVAWRRKMNESFKARFGIDAFGVDD